MRDHKAASAPGPGFRRDERFSIRLLVAASAATLLAACAGSNSTSDLRAPVACADLASVAQNDIAPGRLAVTSAESVAATDTLPAYCILKGELDRRTGADGKPYFIGFELRLPSSWSGRFMFQGGGGTDGAVNPALGAAGTGDTPNALARGYAVVSTDAGHQGRGPEFGLDPQARIDFAYRALGEVATVGRAIAERHYGRPIEHSYIAGCSNGGRQAMMAAQRFPQLFDGALAGNPGFRLTRAAAAEGFNTREFNAIAPPDDQGRPITSQAFSASELKLVSDSVLAACDGLDGLQDGLINDVKACRFDAATLACQQGQTTPCLDPEKTVTLARVFEGPKLPSGESIYGPFPWDAGVAAPGWRAWMLGTSPTAQNNSMNATLGFGSIRYYFRTPADPAYDPATFDAARDWPLMQATREINDAGGAIDAFAKKGGKLMIYHGMSDPVFSAADSMTWIDGLPAGRDAHARLFLVPGMNHCSGGPATDRFDALSALEAWVERGEAPERITAKGAALPNIERPLCSYPKVARFTGGHSASADSFVCAD